MESTQHQKKMMLIQHHIQPMHYHLHLKPDFANLKRFDGCLKIKVKIDQPTNEINLNAAKLNLKNVELKMDNGQALNPDKILHNAEEEVVTMIFPSKISSGFGTLNIDYEGQIFDCEHQGIFINDLGENSGRHGGDQQFCLMTKMDCGLARLVLPCCDDRQEMKATFKLEIDIPKDFDVLCNAAKDNETKIGDGKKKVCFKETRPIDTSSLACTVGKFDLAFTKTHSPSGTKFNFYVMSSSNTKQKACCNWVAEMSTKIWNYLGGTFGQTGCPKLEKLDFLAVPNAPFQGGCGTLGLIQLDEDHFCINQDCSPGLKKQRVALELAKAMVKQLIGGCVNVQERNEIWLEDSLATFVAYHAINKICPEAAIFEQEFTHAHLLQAMNFDMLPTTDPVQIATPQSESWIGKTSFQMTTHSSHIKSISKIAKGVALLRMISCWIGEQTFEKGVVEWASKNCCKWTSGEELWSELETESKKPVKQMIKTWLQKKGYPIVHVTGSVDSGTGNLVINLKQEPIGKHLKKVESLDGKLGPLMHPVGGGSGGQHDEPKCWIIPLTMTTDPKGMQPKMDLLMDKEQLSIIIPAAEYRTSGGFFTINPTHSTFAVINYPEEHLHQVLMPKIKSRELFQPMDRVTLLLDLGKLVGAGIQSTTLLLELIKVIADAGEESFAVWRELCYMMEQMRNVLAEVEAKKGESKMVQKLNHLVQSLMNPQKSTILAEHLWAQMKVADNAKPLEQMTIGLLANSLVLFQDSEISTKAVNTFWKWYRHELGEKIVMGDLQKAMFAAVAMTNDMKVADAFVKIYHDNKFEEAHEYVIHGMAYFTDQMILEKLVNWAMSPEIPNHQTLKMLASMSNHFPVTRNFIWRTLQNKCDYFRQHYDVVYFEQHFMGKFMANFADEKEVNEMAKWMVEKMNRQGCPRMLVQAAEYVKMKQQWYIRDEMAIKKFLERF